MSGLNRGNSKDNSKYDEMSTESLERLLLLDAELPDDEGSDIDEILYISEVIAKREKERPTGRYAAADADAAWETFQTKYLPYLKDGRSFYDFDDDDSCHTGATNSVSDVSASSDTKRVFLRGRHGLRLAASIAAAAAILFGVMTVTACAMGYDLWGVIAQWTKGTFEFVSASIGNNAEDPDTGLPLNEGEYKDLQAALDAYGVTEALVPKWIPEPFELKLVYVDEKLSRTATLFYAYYECDERSIIIQINMHKNPDKADYATWQKDNTNIDTIRVADCTFYRMQNIGRECAIWIEGAFECNINGDISSDEMLKMIESIFE